MGINDFLYSAGSALNRAEERFRTEHERQNAEAGRTFDAIGQGFGAFGAGAKGKANPYSAMDTAPSVPPPAPMLGGSGMYPNPPVDFTANPLDQIKPKDPTTNMDGGLRTLSPSLLPGAPDSVPPPYAGPKGYVHAMIDGKEWKDYTTTASDPSRANTNPSKEIVPAPFEKSTRERPVGVSSPMDISGNTPGARQVETDAFEQELEQAQRKDVLDWIRRSPAERAAIQAAARKPEHPDLVMNDDRKRFYGETPDAFVRDRVAQAMHARTLTPEQQAMAANEAFKDWQVGRGFLPAPTPAPPLR